MVQVLIDDKPIPLDVPVHISPGWVGHLTIEIKNVTHKDIVYGEIILQFPETGTGMPGENKPIFTTVTSLGREPATAFLRKDGTSRRVPDSMLQRPEIRIPPGGTMRFDFSRDADTSEAEAYRLAKSIHTVTLFPRIFFFADGSTWQSGEFLIPQPPPAVWKEVSPDDF
jgi:hypothetical protein